MTGNIDTYVGFWWNQYYKAEIVSPCCDINLQLFVCRTTGGITGGSDSLPRGEEFDVDQDKHGRSDAGVEWTWD